MNTVRLTLRFIDLTREDLADLRDLHKFISEMADENLRHHFLRLIDAVCVAIERRETARSVLEHVCLDAANESTLS